ncbi:MAG TPA: PadR family transcriptional regulator [Nitrolancea sp.]|nr:PadR family transcriptional regulator [Nitrolancea sp.]
MPRMTDRQRGSAEILVLALLRERPMYGYEIIRELAQRSEGYFSMEEGHLYPILHRLERQDLAQTEWRDIDGRRRRYYALTRDGLAALNTGAGDWATFMHWFSQILSTQGGGARVDI